MDYYEIWHDDEYEDLDTLYPLKYFIGHQYRFKHSDTSDTASLFTQSYAQTFANGEVGSLFESADLIKLDKLARRWYGNYIVKRNLYTIDGTDIKTYTLDNIHSEVFDVTSLHKDEWMVLKKVAEWYNTGAIDRSLVENFFIHKDSTDTNTESGEIVDSGSKGASSDSPYVSEKSYGSGADARKTTDTKTGHMTETDTASRKPNDNNSSWIDQNKNVGDTLYDSSNPIKNESTESGKEFIKTYGQLVTSLTRTFGEDGHINERIIDETLNGFRNRNLVRDLPYIFENGGLEWLHIVLLEMIEEIVYMVVEV